jgi:hypothetical protein
MVILRSRRARLNGFIFAAAFLIGEAIVIGVVLAAGSIGPNQDARKTAAQVLELLLGLLLLAASWRLHRGEAPREAGTKGRTQAVLDKLAGIKPAAAVAAGILLGIGGPRRLTISIVTAATISGAGLTTRQDVGLAALYIVVAGLLIWGPVAIYLVAGARARVWLTTAEEWLTANQRLVAVYSLLVFGLVLVGDALAQLL